MGGDKDAPLNISGTLKADYDLGKLLREMIKLLPGTIQLQWIKGHRDEIKCGKKIAGPFLRPVQLNIEMDKYASKGAHMAKGNVVRREVYITTWMGMYTREGVFIDNIKSHLQQEYLGQTLRQYLQQKYKWDDESFTYINWEGVENALSGYQPCYRNRMAQLMHDWQYTGDRKEMMGEGSSQCPFGCKKQENNLHYIWCSEEKMKDARK